MKDVKLSDLCKLWMFADDPFLCKPTSTDHHLAEFQSDIDNVCTGVETDHLSFQPPKCKYMACSYSNREVAVSRDMNIRGTKLERVYQWRYLGVTLDSKLSFIPHTRLAVVKAKRAMGALSRSFGKTAPTSVLLQVYSTCILPAFLYGIEVWYPSAKYCKIDCERVHRQMSRALCNNYVLPYADLLSILHWCPLWRRVIVFQLRLFYKLYYGLHFAPATCLPRPVGRRSSRLTHSCAVELKFTKATTGNQFFYRVSKLWNLLPDRVVTSGFREFSLFIESDQFLEHLQSRRVSLDVFLR